MDFPDRLAHFLDAKPHVHPTAFIAPGAVVFGDVTLEEESSVWFQTVLRGDINRIIIGPRSNVQDGSIIHLADDYGTFVGELVTVGEVLSMTQWDQNELARHVKAQVDAAIKSDRLKPNEAMKLLANYEKALKGYTYLQFNGGNGAVR